MVPLPQPPLRNYTNSGSCSSFRCCSDPRNYTTTSEGNIQDNRSFGWRRAGSSVVNTASNVYHCPGTQYYGKTKAGAYMTEAEAKAKGADADRGKGSN